MNRYIQYIRREKLSHCTLYPNVSDHFPLALPPTGISHLCLLKDLAQDSQVIIPTDYLPLLTARFAPNDLCVITADWSVLISLDNHQHGALDIAKWFNSFIKSNQGSTSIHKLYTQQNWIITTPFDFDIDDYRQDSPLVNAHIFLIDVALKKYDHKPQLFQEQLIIQHIEDGWEAKIVNPKQQWSKSIEPSPSYIKASWAIVQDSKIVLEIPFEWSSYSEKHDFMGCRVATPIFHGHKLN